MTDQEKRAELLRLTSKIVSAHLSKSSVSPADLPGVIKGVYNALASTVAEPEPPPKPAVPIMKSVTPSSIVCLEDGKKFKMLKRHLRTDHGMTPEEYRAKWGLPPDYSMVSPAYAKQRSALAKAAGLGRGPRKVKAKKRRTKA